MNEIVTRKAGARGLRPVGQSRYLGDMMGRFSNRLEPTGIDGKVCISAKTAPTEPERSFMAGRRNELLSSLETDPDRSRKVLLALLGSFPAYGEDEETARFVLAACCRACIRIPAWALEDASSRFLENRARTPWNAANRPTPPQIVAEATVSVVPVEAELYRLGQILDAEVVDTSTTAEERDKALAAWDAIKAGIGRSNVLHERTEDDIAQERSAQQRANTVVREREARAREAKRLSSDPSVQSQESAA